MAIACLTKPLVLLALSANSYGIYKEESRAMFREVRKYFQEIGVCPQIVKIKRIPDLFGRTLYKDNLKRFKRYISFSHRKKLRKLASRVHFILSPEFIEEHRSISGAAYPCSAYSYSTAQLYDEKGAYRMPHSMIALTHELGHSFGALHDTGPFLHGLNIMHPDPLPQVGLGSFKFSEQSKKEILRCLK